MVLAALCALIGYVVAFVDDTQTSSPSHHGALVVTHRVTSPPGRPYVLVTVGTGQDLLTTGRIATG
jgi:hypothetical protein